MAVTYMRHFVSEDFLAILCQIFFRDHDVFHPAEGGDIFVVYSQYSPFFQLFFPSAAYQTEHVCERVCGTSEKEKNPEKVN